MGQQDYGGNQLPGRRGTLRLFSSTLPDLICMLMDLSPAGCRAAVRFQYLPQDLSAQWRLALAPQSSIRVRIEAHPQAGTLELEALFVQMVQTSASYEMEFKFHNLTPAQAEALARAGPFGPGGALQAVPAPRPAPAAFAPPSGLPPRDEAPAGPPGPVPGAQPSSPTRQFRRIGSVLIQMGKLTPQQTEDAAARARATGEKLGQLLLRSGLVSPSALCRALALQSGLPMTDLQEEEIPEKLAKLFPYELMARHEFVPFDDAGAFICIAAVNALPAPVVKELEQLCHKKLEVFLAREDLIRKELQTLHARQEKSSRLHLRYGFSLPVEYQFCTRFGVPAGRQVYQGTTLNISEGGLQVDGPPVTIGAPSDLLRVGMCANLVIEPGTQRELKTLCRLKAIEPRGERCTIRLEIIDASAETRRHLKEICLQALLAQAKPPPAQT
ncbi:MAG: PilZ domain-containing protein [Planctomycetota bacterium]